MIEKTSEKELAIKLRREGKTYREILEVVPVAKSTLSMWLRSVELSKRQEQKFTEKKCSAQKRGGEARRKQRIELTNKIVSRAIGEIGNISERELFLIGTALYWAEGAKEKDHTPGTQFDFINMDSKMISLFLKWLLQICKIPKDMIGFVLYIHESHRNRVDEIKVYWTKITGFPVDSFETIRFKKNKISETRRKNTGQTYYGCLRISVKRSSSLVRRIAGWVLGIIEGVK